MIQIHRKEDCCGCNACVQACPKQCITMRDDEEGFAYPTVDTTLCIDCHLCERVCPVLNQQSERHPLQVLAAINPNEQVRMQSSSGGIFTLLAEQVINHGGVVFGARFDTDWQVIHHYTDTIDCLAPFRGSKYLQSRIGTSFVDARRFLQNGRQVLFSGTPCQIAGLRHFLRRDYPKLLTIEVVCHGVPSPAVWHQYLKETVPENISTVQSISFRDKSTGWKKYSFVLRTNAAQSPESGEVLLHETLDRNLFMQAFLKDWILRPSCHQCPAKAGRSGADISIADFWGIQQVLPHLDDDKGVGLVLINTAKGRDALAAIDFRREEVTYEQATRINPAVYRSAAVPPLRPYFWRNFHQHGIAAIPRTLRKMRPTLLRRAINRAKRLLRSILGPTATQSLKSILRK